MAKIYPSVPNPKIPPVATPLIRDALELFKKPIIEMHISNIYKREEFRHKSLISGVATGGIFGLGTEGYILAIISLQKLLQK